MQKKLVLGIITILILVLGYLWIRNISFLNSQPILSTTWAVNRLTWNNTDFWSWENIVPLSMKTLPQTIKAFNDFPGLVNREITYTQPNTIKPMDNNSSDLFLVFTGKDILEVGSSVMQEWKTEYILDEIYSLDTKEIIIKWAVTNDVEIVEWIRDGDKKIHTINNFKPGTKDFSFIISPNDNNIRPWINKYLVRAYTKSKVYYSLVEITYFDSQDLTLGEKIVKTKENNHQQWKRYPKITKTKACEQNDGENKYDLEVKRPWKNTTVQWFYKSNNIIYYVVYASTSDEQSIEDSDLEVSIFRHDCWNKQTDELVNGDGLSNINIIGATWDSILYRDSPYEWPYAYYIFNTSTQQKVLFDNIYSYANWEKLKEHVIAIQNKYSLTYDGIEYITFSDSFSFENCNLNLICDVRYNRYINKTHLLTYNAKIDIINKIIQ